MKTDQKNKINTDRLYNLDVVEKMCRGKEDLVLKMIKTFVCTMVAAIDELEQAYEKNDFERVQKIVHRIKPTLAIYGITSLEDVIWQIEQMSGNEGESLKLLVEQIVAVIRLVVTELKRERLLN